ncbi:hypothetical protein LAA29_100135 [Leuconostoc carnosum]|nr:hypothetical protein LCAC16_90165 [Leuconostoc carnosum]SPO32986.1 hypothetical protein LAA29_100135 [Leuconostoc carnosum]
MSSSSSSDSQFEKEMVKFVAEIAVGNKLFSNKWAICVKIKLL